jgi:hypothetical protein
MEQRRLRLGDILDDYCPRERRVTNHAVVAMIEDEIKQTRCTTCDAEHAYKGARVPRRRKKDAPDALYKEVLAGLPEAEDVPVLAAAVPSAIVPAALAPSLTEPYAVSSDLAPAPEPPASVPLDESDADGPADVVADEDFRAGEASEDTPLLDGPVHRPLIRATLPRPEGQKEARPVPDFTVRHTQSRGAHGNAFRGGDRTRMRPNGNAPREANGNRAGARFQGNRQPGQPRHGGARSGGPSGFRNGNLAPHGKRGRGSRG